MKKGKNWLVLLLALLLAASLLPARAAGVIFTALNDTVPALSSDGMPVWSGGVLYVPYQTFNSNQSGVDMDIYTSYSRSENTLTVYDARHILVFDLASGQGWDDLSDKTYTERSMVRNGQPYLPVKTVCEHFNLEYSYLSTKYGDLLRIKDENAVLGDTRFVEAASNLMERRLREYNQGPESLPPVQTTPQQPQTPSREEEPGQEVESYLAFRCERGEEVTDILPQLRLQGVSAMFYLPPELLADRPELVLELLGSGHSVGILAWGESPEDTQDLLIQGRRAMEELICLRTTNALVPADHREAMAGQGWVCWNSTLDLAPGDATGANYFARTTLTRLEGRTRATYLTLEVNGNTVRVLHTLLRELEGAGFDLRTPLETRI